MTLTTRQTIGFMHLVAVELRHIAREPYVQGCPDELPARLRMIADKLTAEAGHLEVTLAPKEEKDGPRR